MPLHLHILEWRASLKNWWRESRRPRFVCLALNKVIEWPPTVQLPELLDQSDLAVTLHYSSHWCIYPSSSIFYSLVVNIFASPTTYETPSGLGRSNILHLIGLTYLRSCFSILCLNDNIFDINLAAMYLKMIIFQLCQLWSFIFLSILCF